jgi:hypothetical protein
VNTASVSHAWEDCPYMGEDYQCMGRLTLHGQTSQLALACFMLKHLAIRLICGHRCGFASFWANKTTRGGKGFTSLHHIFKTKNKIQPLPNTLQEGGMALPLYHTSYKHFSLSSPHRPSPPPIRHPPPPTSHPQPAPPIPHPPPSPPTRQR